MNTHPCKTPWCCCRGVSCWAALDWDEGDLGGLACEAVPLSASPSPSVKRDLHCRGLHEGALGVLLSRAVWVTMHQEPGAKSRYSFCLLDAEVEKDFPVAPKHPWTSLPCSHSLFSKASALGLGAFAASPTAHSPVSLSSDLAQGHLQLGHLGRDFRADTSPISPSEVEGQSPTAVRYRNNNQRRFSMEASTAAGWSGQKGRGKSGCHPSAGWKGRCLIQGAETRAPVSSWVHSTRLPRSLTKPGAHPCAHTPPLFLDQVSHRCCTRCFGFNIDSG